VIFSKSRSASTERHSQVSSLIVVRLRGRIILRFYINMGEAEID